MTSYVMLPGIYDSGPTHWQTLWESDRSFVRFEPPDWDEPVRAEWIAVLEAAVALTPEPPVLVAHSLSCLLVPMWAAESDTPVAGAFLVAPVDPSAPAFPDAADEFRDVPRGRLRFPALVVGSVDDHYADVEFSRQFAADLGADFVMAGALGHINADSGLGDWPRGRDLLTAFVAGLGGGSPAEASDV